VTHLSLVQSRLGTEFGGALPAQAPSLFWSTCSDQWDGVRAILEGPGHEHRLRASDHGAPLRIDQPVEEIEARRGERARRPLARAAPDLAGRARRQPSGRRVAVERSGARGGEPGAEYARRSGVGLGSTLTFDIRACHRAPRDQPALDQWRAGINFFLVVEPGVLDDAPQMRLAAARLDRP
jgi:predicted lysophospholipase L1 biosynthesis ABC-type transport system permease subunit